MNWSLILASVALCFLDCGMSITNQQSLHRKAERTKRQTTNAVNSVTGTQHSINSITERAKACAVCALYINSTDAPLKTVLIDLCGPTSSCETNPPQNILLITELILTLFRANQHVKTMSDLRTRPSIVNAIPVSPPGIQQPPGTTLGSNVQVPGTTPVANNNTPVANNNTPVANNSTTTPVASNSTSVANGTTSGPIVADVGNSTFGNSTLENVTIANGTTSSNNETVNATAETTLAPTTAAPTTAAPTTPPGPTLPPASQQVHDLCTELILAPELYCDGRGVRVFPTKPPIRRVWGRR